jgi:hypothetical protein
MQYPPTRKDYFKEEFFGTLVQYPIAGWKTITARKPSPSSMPSMEFRSYFWHCCGALAPLWHSNKKQTNSR